MTKHTPPPWHFVGDFGFNARIVKDTPDRLPRRKTLADSIDNEADGRLMAAAPELLEACQNALRGFESLREYLQTCAVKSPHGLPLTLRDRLEIENALIETIASATGDQSP